MNASRIAIALIVGAACQLWGVSAAAAVIVVHVEPPPPLPVAGAGEAAAIASTLPGEIQVPEARLRLAPVTTAAEPALLLRDGARERREATALDFLAALAYLFVGAVVGGLLALTVVMRRRRQCQKLRRATCRPSSFYSRRTSARIQGALQTG